MKLPKLKYSQELLFLALAILFLLIIVAFVSWNLTFLVSRLDAIVSSEDSRPTETTRFNFEEFEKMNLLKPKE